MTVPPMSVPSTASSNELQGASDEDSSWITPADRALLGHLDGDALATRLPRGTQAVRLVGEGSANAVFEIKVPSGCGGSEAFKGKLLRVAKSPSYNYLVQQKFFHTTIKPILGKYAVRQDLVVLRGTDIINDLNAVLEAADPLRKPKFRGSSVSHSSWGFLVEDMRPDSNDRILVEFKPKWLSQSPSAPANAIRCRQCAVQLRNFVRDPGGRPHDAREGEPCPLALGNPDAPRQVSSPFRIAPQLRGQGGRVEAALVKVAHHDVIRLLREQQRRLDKMGPLKASRSDPCFPLAMTLRDCTCFASIPGVDERERGDDDVPTNVRLGDLDWKDPKAKLAHWTETERSLVQGGFYTADWILCRSSSGDVQDGNGTYYYPPTACASEWTAPGTPRGGPEILLLVDEDTRDGEMIGTGATRMYRHKTNVESAQAALRGSEREPDGTSSDAMYNPFRVRPP